MFLDSIKGLIAGEYLFLTTKRQLLVFERTVDRFEFIMKFDSISGIIYKMSLKRSKMKSPRNIELNYSWSLPGLGLNLIREDFVIFITSYISNRPYNKVKFMFYL